MQRVSAAGLIPAHAGKTSWSGVLFYGVGAHPRSRGENRSTRGTSRNDTGSSPLTRGKPIACAVVALTAGLIPAHAGKTHARCIRPRSNRAHPRSRGENVIAVDLNTMREGSSPLTRGKPDSAPHPLTNGWLIPAHAGKTVARREQEYRPVAHPRSRGENTSQSYGASPAPGSSPLTRGKLTAFNRLVNCDGLIPAHAGKTPQ